MLKMKNINKSFGTVQVLKDVSFSVHAGEVHALLGVNGAGKSTLMKILSGDYEKDSGEIYINENEVKVNHPKDAKREGIGIVVQEVDTALIPSLSVAENVVLDTYTDGAKLSYLSWKDRKNRAKEMLQNIDVNINVNKLVAECSLSEKQMILIARAVSSNVKYLILDEPTAPLSERETEKLFHVIERLKDNGVGIIYISHRMPEIKQITDKFTVMRDGEVIFSDLTKNVEVSEIIGHMLGRELRKTVRSTNAVQDGNAFEVTNLFVPTTNRMISLSVRKGEVLGVAGLVGAGKSETARAIFGADRTKGNWYVNGVKQKINSTHTAIQAGICFVPEERRKEGILVDFSVKENLSLPFLKIFSQWGWLRKSKESAFSEQQIHSLGIKTSSLDTKLKYLSGGNQQKVSIGKWSNDQAKVFLFDEPTKGIDVGAKKDVFQLVSDLAEEGKGIIYFTSEFDELLEIADRIIVMYDGEIVEILTNEEATREKLMQAATGGNSIEAST